MENNVAIILTDTLRAEGVKYILREFYGISSAQPEIDDSESYDLYITDSETLASNIDFFIPRRTKTLVIASSHTGNHSAINCHAPIDTIIDIIGKKLEEIEKNSERTICELSAREIDVLKLIASGLANKEIADKLGISINTVLTHRKNITSKLGIRSVSGLSFYAMMNGYISPIQP